MISDGQWGGVMIGRGYAIFDTAVGRCGIVWSYSGVLSVQLPQAREIDTRRRLYQLHPEAREAHPPVNTEIAIDGITAILRGKDYDLADVKLDMGGVPHFSQRVYDFVRTIPRGETRTYSEVARQMRREGTEHAIAQAIAKNPFMIIVPCHRALENGHYADRIAPNGGTISKRHLLSIEGTHLTASKTLFDVLLPVVPPRPHH